MVLVRDLDQFAVGEAVPTPATSERLGLDVPGGVLMLATLTFRHAIGAGTLATLEVDDVDAADVGAARDAPDPEGDPRDLLEVLLCESDTAREAGGRVRGCAILSGGHEELLLRGPGSGVLVAPPGPFLLLTP
jgi:hypothetical protein